MKQEIARFAIEELDHFSRNFQPSSYEDMMLRGEPFIGTAETINGNGERQRFLFCRNYTPSALSPANKDAMYASYLAPMGEILAKEPGERYRFSVQWSRTQTDHHDHSLEAKASFLPAKRDGMWDAVDARLSWREGTLFISSLRRIMRDFSGTQPAPVSAREVTLKVELPGQAVLDSAQDEIFRLPLNSRVRISGAPGTGKTTLLLKRLSQKTKLQFLTAEEKALYPTDEWKDQDWLLFAPSDLLKSYVEKALAKEMLPAGDEHVKIYWTLRRELLRGLGVLRVGNQGSFRALVEDESPLLPLDAAQYARLIRTLEDFSSGAIRRVASAISLQFRDKISKLTGGIIDQIRILETTIEDVERTASSDFTLQSDAVDRVKRIKGFIRDLETIINNIQNQKISESAGGIESVSALYRYHLFVSSAKGRIQGIRMPDVNEGAPQMVINTFLSEITEVSESISIRNNLRLLTRIYSEFRQSPEASAYFSKERLRTMGDQREGLSNAEQDLLLYSILGFIRGCWSDLNKAQSDLPRPVRDIIGLMRTNICIDEATDFSALEIACMERFAHPIRGGVTLCGDLMQRITTSGITNWSDLEVISKPFHPCELLVGYRQTNRLFEVARNLYRHVTNDANVAFRSAYEPSDADPPPLVWKASPAQAAKWLHERICEIFGVCDNQLPSTAVLVPTAADIEPFANQLRSLLQDSGIEVDAATTGQNLGNPSRVRVFPVESIKGLEFEAVFYLEIDRMTELHAALVDKYFYVGLSRARSFLAMTYSQSFPERFNCIRNDLATQETFRSHAAHTVMKSDESASPWLGRAGLPTQSLTTHESSPYDSNQSVEYTNAKIPSSMTVVDLANRLNLKPFQVLPDLIKMGVFPAPDQMLEAEVVAKICALHGKG